MGPAPVLYCDFSFIAFLRAPLHLFSGELVFPGPVRSFSSHCVRLCCRSHQWDLSLVNRVCILSYAGRACKLKCTILMTKKCFSFFPLKATFKDGCQVCVCLSMVMNVTHQAHCCCSVHSPSFPTRPDHQNCLSRLQMLWLILFLHYALF